MQLYRDVARGAFIRQPLGDIEYIHVFGEIDSETDDDFRSAIADASRNAKRIVVDLTRCTYVGSQGFSVLVNAKKLMDLSVIAPPRIRRLLDIVGLTSLLSEPNVIEDVAVEP